MTASFGLRDITSRMRACTLCNSLPLGPNPIFQLDEQAKILIVGQAPGRKTHLKNRPFDDTSGDRLRDWLALDKSTFYTDPRLGIFPMALCFPGTGTSGDLPPPKVCATTWRHDVMKALTNVELTLVLGAYAVAWHLPHLQGQNVTQAVKHAAKGADGIFVLPHPSPRNNRWLKQNPWFEADVIPKIRQAVAQLLPGTQTV